MSGNLNWQGRVAPIHTLNQPLLLPYFLAGTRSVLGKSEPALHLSFSLFTLLAAFCFFRMVEDVSLSRAGPLTVLFVLGPHLLPGQNLMTDVPMMALGLAAMRAHWSAATRPVVGGIAAAAAMLTKYTSLVLGFVFVLDGILGKRRAPIVSAAIAAAVLVLWSLFNYVDYGGIHLLERPAAGSLGLLRPDRVAAWLICLGAVAPCSLPASLFSGGPERDS